MSQSKTLSLERPLDEPKGQKKEAKIGENTNNGRQQLREDNLRNYSFTLVAQRKLRRSWRLKPHNIGRQKLTGLVRKKTLSQRTPNWQIKKIPGHQRSWSITGFRNVGYTQRWVYLNLKKLYKGHHGYLPNKCWFNFGCIILISSSVIRRFECTENVDEDWSVDSKILY